MARQQVVQPNLPKARHWRFGLDFERIGWLTFDVEGSPINTLSREALSELEQLVLRFEDLIASGELIGVVLMSGKDSGFIAGADINEFDAMTDAMVLTESLRRTHSVFDRIEALRAPIVACIHGFCLGGGLELALACHYRVAVNDGGTRLGFPEVNLGLFPGFGGTGRSMRLAGPVEAMQLMLKGTRLRASAARRANLIDRVVRHRDALHWAGRKAVLQKSKSQPADWLRRVAAMGPLRKITADRMRAEVARKARPEHYPAPHSLIELFEQHGDNPKAMIRGEIERFVPLLATDTAVNLRRVFFLTEGLKKQGLRGADKPNFRRVHVIGAGVMGGDIAAWCALRGLAVTLQDLDVEHIAPALERARALFKKRLRKRHEVDLAMARLEADVAGRGMERADVIIEAVVEKLEVKRQVFLDVEARAREDAVIATNTSAIALERIAAGLAQPSRLIGLHFFNPVAQLPLVEVVRSSYNSDDDIARGASFALAVGKSPVVVKSAPGFLVNRVLMPYMLGAVERVERGESKELIDAAAVAFGMPMGPIELMDTVGLDVGRSVAIELGHSVPPTSRFAALVEGGRLGRKTGEGFYVWKNGSAVKGPLPEQHGDLAGLGRELVKPLVDSAEEVVANGVVANADLADVGVILGTGFAPFLGGPIKARRDGKV